MRKVIAIIGIIGMLCLFSSLQGSASQITIAQDEKSITIPYSGFDVEIDDEFKSDEDLMGTGQYPIITNASKIRFRAIVQNIAEEENIQIKKFEVKVFNTTSEYDTFFEIYSTAETEVRLAPKQGSTLAFFGETNFIDLEDLYTFQFGIEYVLSSNASNLYWAYGENITISPFLPEPEPPEYIIQVIWIVTGALIALIVIGAYGSYFGKKKDDLE